MALTKLDPSVIGQDSSGSGKITSAGGSVSIDSSGNVRIANSSANSVIFAANGATTFTSKLTANAGITFADASVQSTAASGFGFKNRIINGAMMIDQRNNGGTVTSGHQTTTFCVDRFNTYKDNTSAVVTMQRTTVAPPGFSHSLLVKPTTGSAPTAAQELQLRHSIEGFNIADFNWGTANAVDIVLSFWVRSSLVGTFAFGVQSYGSGTTYVTTYTIDQADTWERKTISIPKVTTGTWAVNNMPTMNLIWDLGGGSNYNTTPNTWTSGNYYTTAGTTKLVSATNATFYITGVQIEKGTTSTSFDYRPYGTELALCQRYCFTLGNGVDSNWGIGRWEGTAALIQIIFPQQMRSVPTITIPNMAGLQLVYPEVAWYNVTGLLGIHKNGTISADINVGTANAPGTVPGKTFAQLAANSGSPMLLATSEI